MEVCTGDLKLKSDESNVRKQKKFKQAHELLVHTTQVTVMGGLESGLITANPFAIALSFICLLCVNKYIKIILGKNYIIIYIKSSTS
jgi:hypothetical protein